jgi:hypothetical protein
MSAGENLGATFTVELPLLSEVCFAGEAEIGNESNLEYV